ncbi:hypothetical protein AZI85_00520 [Bdellovibrio bacteriovorus]|uniref:Amine oxidase domain-containing protein n=1 Tax=Bdellovibrio bacteriovorus TaxID=959 RepID=A0A150WVC5_BDEBC|nr:FAD-dependent oxidoreductase [Bdellovibrio bacteriovorus]KYG70468.1 hypothetical protein AZI85_00520 [Bdellovibrio bacteriovorus]
MKKISVIGAGFAGLSLSLRLAQKGFEVDIYEKGARVGGLIGTDKNQYGLAEQAANSMIRTANAEALFKDIGLTPLSALESSKKRFIFREKPRPWPLYFSETVQFIGKLVFNLLRGKKNLSPRENETLQSWGYRIIGAPATQFILSPGMQGIYGNATDELSASLILGPLINRKKKDKSQPQYKGIMTGPEGMQDVIDRLEAKLKDLGVRIHLNSNIKVSELKGPVVVATSAQSASEILKSSHAEIAARLSRIQMTSLMSVTVYFSKSQNTYPGFGCLIPRYYGLKALGILMNSYIFAGRDKTYSETWIFGGAHDTSILDMSDAEVLKTIATERFRILGNKEALLDYRIFRWRNALPFYNIELEKTLKDLSAQKLPEGLFLHGNYLGGIGLSKILERGDKLAEEIASRYV